MGMLAQAAFVRVHQDFTRNVLRGAKPHVVKDVRGLLGRDISLEDFKYWTALVRTACSPRCNTSKGTRGGSLLSFTTFEDSAVADRMTWTPCASMQKMLWQDLAVLW